MANAHHIRRPRPSRFSQPSSLHVPSDAPKMPDAKLIPVPILFLKRAVHRLRTVRASVIISSAVLHQQNADLDADVAAVLQHHVADQLTLDIEQLETLAAGSKGAQ